MAQEIKCTFNTTSERGWTCIKQQNIYSKNIILSPSSSAISVTITRVYFDECMMNAFPSSDSIKKFMPNLEVLYITRSKLSEITAEDLKGFECLKTLYVARCGIEYLPGDLFKHTPHLKYVSFDSNKIKYIDEGILEPLQNLKLFNLLNNVNINAYYNTSNNIVSNSTNGGNVTLAQLKHKFATNCKKPPTYDELLVKITTLEIAHKKEVDDLKAKYEELKEKLEAVLQNQAIKK